MLAYRENHNQYYSGKDNPVVVAGRRRGPATKGWGL